LKQTSAVVISTQSQIEAINCFSNMALHGARWNMFMFLWVHSQVTNNISRGLVYNVDL